jgi:immune inhibitor A
MSDSSVRCCAPASGLECLVPPSPQLEAKIIASRRRLRAGLDLPAMPTMDLLDLKMYTRILTRPPATRANTLTTGRGDRAPVTGTRRVIVLLADFPDLAGARSRQDIHDLLFSRATYATGSMRDYYAEVSRGALDVIGEVHGWFRAPQPKTYYTNGDNGFGDYPRNAQKLVEDVLALADGTVDFSPYDNDGNGVIEALIVIVAGSGAEVTGNADDIWSHKWSITPKTLDRSKAIGYFMAPEDGRVGVMAHELGHLLLGMPDLYDTDYSSRGTGAWDLMAGGSWNNGGNTPAHPCAWVKAKVGWAVVDTVFNAEQNVTLTPYASDNRVCKLPIGTADSKQYFLLSNRRKIGFDAHLPGEGLIIEHVDENQLNNTDESHYLVDIEQCDGKLDLNKNANAGDASDAYPAGGQDRFTALTTPTSKAYDGTDSGIEVTAIAASGTNITAKIKVGAATEAGAGSAWHNDCKVLQTFASADAQNAWANIEGLGWRRMKPGAADGVTNLFQVFTAAQAGGCTVSAAIDQATQLVTIAYLSTPEAGAAGTGACRTPTPFDHRG